MVTEPEDSARRRAIPPVICYPNDALPRLAEAQAARARDGWLKVDEVRIAPRDAALAPPR